MTSGSVTIHLDEGMLSDRGRVRPLNEDSYGSFRSILGESAVAISDEVLRRKGYLYVVADGMGGHDSGDLASATAVQQICAAYYADTEDDPAASLHQAIAQANRAVYATAQARRRPGRRPMGTTVVCAVIHEQTLTLAHVGDSRAYRLRDGTLTCLTADHDWITEQMRTHSISRAEAEQRARERGARGALMRAVGVQPDTRPDLATFDWRPGDVLLLSSDGLHGMISDDRIARILAENPAPLAARELIASANQAGGHDNITAMVVRGGMPPALLPGIPPWRKLIQFPAWIAAVLLLLLGFSVQVASNGTHLTIANNVLELAGLPTLQPTVGLLPTATATAMPTLQPTATPTATGEPIAATVPANQAPRATARPGAPSQPVLQPQGVPGAPFVTIVPPQPSIPPGQPAPSAPEPPSAPPPAQEPPGAPPSGPPSEDPAPPSNPGNPAPSAVIPPTQIVPPATAIPPAQTAAPPTAAPPGAPVPSATPRIPTAIPPAPPTQAPSPPTQAPAPPTQAPAPPTQVPPQPTQAPPPTQVPPQPTQVPPQPTQAPPPPTAAPTQAPPPPTQVPPPPPTAVPPTQAPPPPTAVPPTEPPVPTEAPTSIIPTLIVIPTLADSTAAPPPSAEPTTAPTSAPTTAPTSAAASLRHDLSAVSRTS